MKLWLTRKEKQRVRLEDTLKFCYHAHKKDLPVSPEMLGDHLRISSKAVLRLIADMEKRGLIRVTGDGLQLTPHGSAWALQIIRAHRLWERYLVETGAGLEEIHQLAENKEHQLTPQEVNELDATLGYPKRDPHGDPIPGSGEDLPKEGGTSLLDWPAGKPARIVHIEDEPQSIYLQIINEGLILDSCLKVTDSGPQGLHIRTIFHDCWLAPIVAGNIYVDEPPAWFDEKNITLLSDIGPGEKVEVVSLHAQGLSRRRFQDLGLVPGTEVEVALESIFKDPRAYHVRGSILALRKDQARQIIVKRSDQ